MAIAARVVRSWLALTFVFLGACWAVIDFDTSKVSSARGDGSVRDGALDGSVPGPQANCEPGRAGLSCAQCKAGEFCAGGNAAAAACGADFWDHDANPATACIGQRN